MDGCLLVFGLMFGLPALAGLFQNWEKSRAAAKAKAAEEAAKAADEQFLRDHPDAWLARQRADLERERLGAIKKYANEESGRQTAGLAAGILRAFFK